MGKVQMYWGSYLDNKSCILWESYFDDMSMGNTHICGYDLKADNSSVGICCIPPSPQYY